MLSFFCQKGPGPPGKTNVKLNVAGGGSVQAFHALFKQQLTAFMNDQNARLKIYNPASFEVWRQDSKPYQNQASMAQLTPTEITRIISEIGLELCSTAITDHAGPRKAKRPRQIPSIASALIPRMLQIEPAAWLATQVKLPSADFVPKSFNGSLSFIPNWLFGIIFP